MIDPQYNPVGAPQQSGDKFGHPAAACGVKSEELFGLSRRFEVAWPVSEWRAVHVVAAVSGGADSVAMLRALHALKQSVGGDGRLFVAHFNHRLRGADADADAAWVVELCRELGLHCEVGVASESPTDGSEQAARDARYAFLTATAERLGARFLSTAHTADDQVETVLMRLMRGTGIAGLAGVPQCRPLNSAVTLVRPLLAATRAQVLHELNRLGQPFREDATNVDQRYTRNRVRHSLLPSLREQFGDGVDQSLLRIAEQAAEAQAVVESAARQLAESAIERSADAIRVDRSAAANAAPLVLAEAVKLAWRAAGWPEQEMGRQQWRLVVDLVRTDDGPPAIDFPDGVHARRDTDSVRLVRR